MKRANIQPVRNKRPQTLNLWCVEVQPGPFTHVYIYLNIVWILIVRPSARGPRERGSMRDMRKF